MSRKQDDRPLCFKSEHYVPDLRCECEWFDVCYEYYLATSKNLVKPKDGVA
jgi:hypothetical protein